MTSESSSLVLLSDPSKGTSAKASSVLQRNAKLNGPMNALDCGNPSTSWNSDGSSSGKHESFFTVDFGRVVTPTELRLQFQAGFSAEEVVAHFQNSETGAWETMIDLEMEDAHGVQKIDLLEDGNSSTPTKAIKLTFDECTDFYGRIIIYQLQVWGHEAYNSNDTSESQKEE